MKELKTIISEYDNKIDELFNNVERNIKTMLNEPNETKYNDLLCEYRKLSIEHNRLLVTYLKLLKHYNDLLTDRINSKGNEND